jgi:L-threonylcarbamoyladenylate synthase
MVIDSTHPCLREISIIIETLKKGKVIIYPTDTVYGLGVNALDPEAVYKIFRLKKRPLKQALPIAVSGLKMAQSLVTITEKAKKLMEAFWPGALTIILKKTLIIPEIVTGGKIGVGVRAPNHPIPLTLVKMLNFPIIATSANIHGESNPVNANEISSQLGKSVDLIIDGGTVRGTPSTIINMLREPPQIIRKGRITEEMIRKRIGKIAIM